MSTLFIGGSSEIALKTAKKLKNIDQMGRFRNPVYKKNFITKNYSQKNLVSVFNKIKFRYDNIVIFNGRYSNSFITNFNKKDFDDALNINLIIPLQIAKIIIDRKILKKNGAIFFTSSIATSKNYVGNAYYSIAKNSLELAGKILAIEQRKRGVRINIMSIGAIKNTMGMSVIKYLNKTAQKKIKFINMSKVVNKIEKYLKNKSINQKKINLDD